MPAIADITVKKNDGTTDVVYVAMAPSSGDTVPAVWRLEAAATVAAFKPKLEMRTRNNGDRTARRDDIYFVYPITQTDTGSGITQVVGQIPFNLSGVFPLNCPDTIIAEAVSQFANLMTSTLIKNARKAGFAPT